MNQYWWLHQLDGKAKIFQVFEMDLMNQGRRCHRSRTILAIALELTLTPPNAGDLILQSSFTSMAAAVQQKAFTHLMPVERMLTERVESLKKISSLPVPMRLRYGNTDIIVPADMSQQLYNAEPEPKHLHLNSQG